MQERRQKTGKTTTEAERREHRRQAATAAGRKPQKPNYHRDSRREHGGSAQSETSDYHEYGTKDRHTATFRTL